MFERFTERARRSMGFARQAAQRLGSRWIDTEHLLLGLLEEPAGVAHNVLRNLDVSIEALAAALPPPRAGLGETAGQMPFTQEAKRALELAWEEAQSLGHNYVGTEHMLLGLLRVEDGAAACALRSFGLSLEDVREDAARIASLAAPCAPIDPPPAPGTAMVLLPPGEAAARAFDRAIRPALAAHGLTARPVEDLYEHEPAALGRLRAELLAADLVLADASGRDPGVAFALGLCAAEGIAPLLLVHDPGDLPAGLRGARSVSYDPLELDLLRDRLRRAVTLARERAATG